jgi:hypothetical protein
MCKSMSNTPFQVYWINKFIEHIEFNKKHSKNCIISFIYLIFHLIQQETFKKLHYFLYFLHFASHNKKHSKNCIISLIMGMWWCSGLERQRFGNRQWGSGFETQLNPSKTCSSRVVEKGSTHNTGILDCFQGYDVKHTVMCFNTSSKLETKQRH